MSASPAPSDAETQPKSQEQISFRFCRECSNMLYPKEDRMSNTLMFACRTCQFSEPAASSCVFRNNLYNTVGETAGVTQDVGSDPTVGAAFNFCTCTLCGQELVCDFCDASEIAGAEEIIEDDSIEFEEDLGEGWREEMSAAEESEITECEEDYQGSSHKNL